VCLRMHRIWTVLDNCVKLGNGIQLDYS